MNNSTCSLAWNPSNSFLYCLDCQIKSKLFPGPPRPSAVQCLATPVAPSTHHGPCQFAQVTAGSQVGPCAGALIPKAVSPSRVLRSCPTTTSSARWCLTFPRKQHLPLAASGSATLSSLSPMRLPAPGVTPQSCIGPCCGGLTPSNASCIRDPKPCLAAAERPASVCGVCECAPHLPRIVHPALCQPPFPGTPALCVETQRPPCHVSGWHFPRCLGSLIVSHSFLMNRSCGFSRGRLCYSPLVPHSADEGSAAVFPRVCRSFSRPEPFNPSAMDRWRGGR